MLATTSHTFFTNSDSEESPAELWQLGLSNLLADDAEEAQASFLMPFFNVESEAEEEFLQSSLLQFLWAAAAQQEQDGSLENTCKIIGFVQDLFPNHLNNLLHLIILSVQTDCFDVEMLAERNLLPLLAAAEVEEIDRAKLRNVIELSIQLASPRNSQLISEDLLPTLLDALLQKTMDIPGALTSILTESFVLAQNYEMFDLQASCLEVCLKYCPEEIRFDIQCHLSTAVSASQDHAKSISYAKALAQGGREPHDELRTLVARENLLKCLMRAGCWQEIPSVSQRLRDSIEVLIAKGWSEPEYLGPMAAAEYFLNYVDDQPRVSHRLRNSLGQIVAPLVRQKNPHSLVSTPIPIENVDSVTPKVLNIGYIASTLTKHSVGWLSRWLFLHHDKQSFQIFIYNLCVDDQNEFNIKHFAAQSKASHYFGVNVADIVEQIRKDRIDILIDLDSLAFTTTYEVLCCRPAPVQVTWLGWDTSGCPEIDYFIADPHVLPADAEEYYHPKIWRLPETYLAVDGFEVGVPTKHRSDYGIPAEAIVYLCGQNVFKYHPDILRLQMLIIKEVPNSYLLMKMRGDRDSTIDRFRSMADEVGISVERLRFIEPDLDEYTHRANLSLADVVLDTFPYNGATTTLETIWAGVPMVTKVGQSFVARNSYAFLTTAGITEGIAHTDEEYVAWGVKLGSDLQLRQQVMGKMIQSRKTSALWDTKKFTAEMENAYRQMWAIHRERQAGMSI
jgi:predicted O-linked N-acetylglucosamine transferase (SPINDLY family)